MKKTNKQHGAVSLFVVIFAALLITVVTVSFIRIMIQNQQQSTANDLSRSAYDSAQAGVEDGKRAILLLQNKCDPTSPTFVDQNTCDTAQALYSSLSSCNAAVDQLSDVIANKATDGTNEILVKSSSGNVNLNQAYTCVKIITDTPYVEGSLLTDESKLIPLVGITDFDKIKIEWYTRNNLLDPNNTKAIVPPNGFGTHLLMKSSWQKNLASVMRAQLIEFNSTFKVSDFDNGAGSNNTLFLYPSYRNVNSTNFAINSHPTNLLAGSPGTPSEVICTNISAGGYSCSATIQLPKSITIVGGVAKQKAYLNLKSLYKASDYKVSLINSADPTKSVNFKNVQPEIDSTGRANDIFRRVRTRVELSDSDFPFPQAEIDVTGNLCKTFFVTDPAKDPDALNHYKPGSCTP